jgi:outer membrane receptor protein involved in Fe transport
MLMSDIRLDALRGRALVAGALLGLAMPAGAGAQQTRPDSTKPQSLGTVTVTATRSPKDVFSTPAPVNVIDSTTLQSRLPNSPVDLFRMLPGLDVTGVGTTQVQPMIRGQHGQRILMLEDGLRLNNSRRQPDFGEIPAVAGIVGPGRTEVVRGPASVLYGTDAIGGVINLLSPSLPFDGRDGVHGAVAARFGTIDDQRLPSAGVQGKVGRLAFRGNVAYRETNDYRIPSGTFGGIDIPEETKVEDTGIRDRSYDLQLGLQLPRHQRLTAKGELYQADQAGFGFVRTPGMGTTEPLIQILYPNQRFTRYSLGYTAEAIPSFAADRVQITGYTQGNERDLNNNIFIPFGPRAHMDLNTHNFTDMTTYGMRVEAKKLFAGRHVLTYGVDGFRDRSENADSSRQAIIGFGPPQVVVSTTPQLPNATYRSGGIFAQAELHPIDRLALTLGARGQEIVAKTQATPNLDAAPVESRDRTVVGAANVLVRATESLNLIGSVGRGFRSPNLVERFFNGPLAEGDAFQRQNLDLDPETSVNVDVGARFRRGLFFAEAFVFRNELRDGIAPEQTGDSVSGLPVYQNVNIGKLRYLGGEAAAGLELLNGLGVNASFSRLTSKNVSDPDTPLGETYSSKLVGDLHYRTLGGRVGAGYTVRYQGKQKDVIVGDSPIGDFLPSFTVHSLRAQLVVFDRGSFRNTLTAVVDNLTDELYAEFANAGFFRPEPGRTFKLGWTTEF